MKDDKIDYDLISFVLASEYRKIIIKELKVNYRTPKALSEKIEKPMSHTSKTLKELKDKDIVICKTPKKRKGRIYDLTELGEEIFREIE